LLQRLDRDMVQTSIDRLKLYEPPEGYHLAFSGGKDSIVVKRLAEMAGVKFDAHYSLTTVDPPELVYYIREHHPDVSIDLPEYTMWQLIVKKRVPPTRTMRYCCDYLKERKSKGRLAITGVRWAESNNRKRNQGVISTNRQSYSTDNEETRQMVESCYKTQTTMLNPIVDWTDADVWTFIREQGLPYCELYDHGFKRLGCIGCPMSSKARQELDAYPKFKQAYLRAFERMIQAREERGLGNAVFSTPEQCLKWMTTLNLSKSHAARNYRKLIKDESALSLLD